MLTSVTRIYEEIGQKGGHYGTTNNNAITSICDGSNSTKIVTVGCEVESLAIA